MGWTVPLHKKAQVDRAGRVFADGNAGPELLDQALDVINNWRSSHSFPLNTFQVTLRRNARAVDPKALVAQRIKRLSSIHHKLSRFQSMQLSQMQDIGGCRAVLKDVQRVKALGAAYRGSSIKHILAREYDYIKNPKPSGYRSLHLVYRYQSDKKTTYNGLQIEMQVRSQLQHAWATAVETVGTFLQQALKSSQGQDEWLRFFSLMGSALALREGTPLVPGTPSNQKELVRELKSIARTLQVQHKLESYGRAVQTLQGGSGTAHYYLLALEPTAGTVTVTGFDKSQLEQATQYYVDVEKSLSGKPGAEAVLVSVESIDSLRRAYPNYFLDTRKFIETVKEAIA